VFIYLPSSTLFLLVALNKAARGTDGRTTPSLAWPVLRRPALLCALSVPLCHGAHVLDCWLRCSRVSRPLSLVARRSSPSLVWTLSFEPSGVVHGAVTCCCCCPTSRGPRRCNSQPTGQTRTTYFPPSDHCHTLALTTYHRQRRRGRPQGSN